MDSVTPDGFFCCNLKFAVAHGKLEGNSNKPLLADKADCFVKAFQAIDKYTAVFNLSE